MLVEKSYKVGQDTPATIPFYWYNKKEKELIAS